MADPFAQNTYSLVGSSPTFAVGTFKATTDRPLKKYSDYKAGVVPSIIKLMEDDSEPTHFRIVGDNTREINQHHKFYDTIGGMILDGKIMSGGRRRPSRKYKKSKRVMRRKSRSTRRR